MELHFLTAGAQKIYQYACARGRRMLATDARTCRSTALRALTADNLQALAVKNLDAKALVRKAGFRSPARCGGDPACAVGGTLSPRNRRSEEAVIFVQPYFCMGQPRFKSRCASGCTKNHKSKKWGLSAESGSPVFDAILKKVIYCRTSALPASWARVKSPL